MSFLSWSKLYPWGLYFYNKNRVCGGWNINLSVIYARVSRMPGGPVLVCIEFEQGDLLHFEQKALLKGQMFRILRRHKPRHAGHTLASNKDPLPMKPAVPASGYASSEWRRGGNDSVELSDFIVLQQTMLELWFYAFYFWILLFNACNLMY